MVVLGVRYPKQFKNKTSQYLAIFTVVQLITSTHNDFEVFHEREYD